MTTRWARFTRGLLAAVFSTLIAAVSHTLAGGSSPSSVSLALALAFAAIACLALTGKTLSLSRLAAAVMVSQGAFHALFSTIGTAHPLSMSAGSGAHVHGASALLVGTSTTAPMHHTDGWMWVGHGIAAALTIVALRYGEAAFWRLAEVAVLSVRTAFARVPVAVAPLAAPHRRAILGRFFVPRVTMFLRLSLGLRGPPMASIA